MWRQFVPWPMDPLYHLTEMNDSSASNPKPSAVVPLPRGLILLCCLWITGSWIENIGIRTPIQPIAEDYSYGLRMLCSSMMIGITLGWPLLRLGVSRFISPVRQTFLDILVVISGILVTVWPLRLLSTWSLEQTMLISGILVNWTILSGAIICLGTGSRNGLLRALLIVMLFGLIGVGAMLPDADALTWWRPLDLMLQITLPESAYLQEQAKQAELLILGQTLVAAIGTWLIVLGVRSLGSTSGRSTIERVPSN